MSPSGSRTVRFGSFRRSSDGRVIQRFRCTGCLRSFSRATFQADYRQKKRRLNHRASLYFASQVSQRRAAVLLGVTRGTAARKFQYLGMLFLRENPVELSTQARPLDEIQFDELETFEHTKMKPLSVAIAVDANSRTLLGIHVSRMPAKGLLAERSRAKYGRRRDERSLGLKNLMKDLGPWVGPQTRFRSDSNPHYAPLVKRHFPDNPHTLEMSRTGRSSGFGELKVGGNDPIFSLNHTCAMLRANLSRLARRTWCTTKKPEGLVHHLAIYQRFHNQRLTEMTKLPADAPRSTG